MRRDLTKNTCTELSVEKSESANAEAPTLGRKKDELQDISSTIIMNDGSVLKIFADGFAPSRCASRIRHALMLEIEEALPPHKIYAEVECYGAKEQPELRVWVCIELERGEYTASIDLTHKDNGPRWVVRESLQTSVVRPGEYPCCTILQPTNWDDLVISAWATIRKAGIMYFLYEDFLDE